MKHEHYDCEYARPGLDEDNRRYHYCVVLDKECDYPNCPDRQDVINMRNVIAAVKKHKRKIVKQLKGK